MSDLYQILLMDDDDLYVVQRALEDAAEAMRVESRKSTWHGDNFKAYREDLRERALHRERLVTRIKLHREERNAKP